MYDMKGVVMVNEQEIATFPTDVSHVQSMKDDYVGSHKEEMAIRDAYLKCRGNLKRMTIRVPFLSTQDVDRVRDIIASKIHLLYICISWKNVFQRSTFSFFHLLTEWVSEDKSVPNSLDQATIRKNK